MSRVQKRPQIEEEGARVHKREKIERLNCTRIPMFRNISERVEDVRVHKREKIRVHKRPPCLENVQNLGAKDQDFPTMATTWA